MRLVVNGDERQVEDGATVATLVAALDLAHERVAVEVNRKIVRRAQWPEAPLGEGDVVEIVHFVGGG
jgi:thiamine biosynthesis protein ThiS